MFVWFAVRPMKEFACITREREHARAHSAPMCTRGCGVNVNVVPIGRRREFFEFALAGETAEIKVQSVGMDSCIYMDVDATTSTIAF